MRRVTRDMSDAEVRSEVLRISKFLIDADNYLLRTGASPDILLGVLHDEASEAQRMLEKIREWTKDVEGNPEAQKKANQVKIWFLENPALLPAFIHLLTFLHYANQEMICQILFSLTHPDEVGSQFIKTTVINALLDQFFNLSSHDAFPQRNIMAVLAYVARYADGRTMLVNNPATMLSPAPDSTEIAHVEENEEAGCGMKFGSGK